VFCLVHGLGVGQRYFDPLARELGGELVRPELSEARPISELGAQVAELLAEPTVLVANSLGCQIATRVAVARPELIEALVLIGPTVDSRTHSAVRHVLRLAVDGWYEPPRLLAIVVRDYFRYGPLELVEQARFALADRIEERLPLLAAPTLVVRGAHDPLSPARWCEEATSLLRRGRLVTIGGAGHAAHFSHPREVAAEISRFLGGTRAARG
jgi:pimeloyl-ACP methyl ester carboxylesterase